MPASASASTSCSTSTSPARSPAPPAPLDQGTVIEVGPGPGGLTRALLLEGGARVVAIEKDPRFLAALAELQDAADGRLEVVEADALRIDPATPRPRAAPHRRQPALQHVDAPCWCAG